MISPSGDLSLQRLQMTREINESVREECTNAFSGMFHEDVHCWETAGLDKQNF